MSIDIKEIITRQVIIAPNSRLDAFSAPELRGEIDRLLDEGVKHFVLNLYNVTFLDSSGLAVLVSLLKRVRRVDGDVKLIMPLEETAQRILKLTKFDRIFDVVTTLDEALGVKNAQP